MLITIVTIKVFLPYDRIKIVNKQHVELMRFSYSL